MDKLIIDCETGEESSVPMTDAEIAETRRIQAEVQVGKDAAATARQQQQAAQVSAAAAVVATASDPTQADALKAFFATMGIPVS